MAIVPFDHNPASVAIKTASYTVPDNTYARVSAMSPNFSVGGSVLGEALGSASSTSAATTLLSGSTSVKIRKQAVFKLSYAGSTAVTFTIRDTGTPTTLYTRAYSAAAFTDWVVITVPDGSRTLQSCDVLYTGGDGSHQVAVESYDIQDKEHIWVPAGTALDGSFYFVELYNVPS